MALSGATGNLQLSEVTSQAAATRTLPTGHGPFFKSKHTQPGRAQTSHAENERHGHADVEGRGEKSRPSILSAKRSSTHSVFTNKARSPTEPRRPGTASEEDQLDPRHSVDPLRGEEHPGASHKKKGVSFLSRIIGTKKKDTQHDENESETSDMRPEGIDALPFAQNAENIEFSPKHLEPPAYIKIRSKYKKTREFDRVFLSQELQPTPGGLEKGIQAVKSKLSSSADPNAIWALEWSKSGLYLASGGQDGVVRIWSVLSSPECRKRFEQDRDGERDGPRLQAPVFLEAPYREFKGHDGAIADLAWSKNEFLLSSSLDKTIRLWHPSMTDCLCTFKHADVVLSVQFHPRDDRFFLAGSRDMKLRLWSIPDKSVAYWTQMPDVITAVGFCPDGRNCMAGTINGLVCFFETEGLKEAGQLIARSAHGKNAKGSKINSIECFVYAAQSATPTEHHHHHEGATHHEADVKVLVSSADSRLRVYNLRDKTLESKFKGHKAEELPIKASASDCGRYVVSGSEDRAAYIWTTEPGDFADKPNQRPVESFEASRDKTTAVAMAPRKTKVALATSGDPIYDLCNPPPITLLSRAESVISSKPATEPPEPHISDSPPKHRDTTLSAPAQVPGAMNPAYQARHAHNGGHILVTASTAGKIRVYRQDCAYNKRRSGNAMEAASALANGRKNSSQIARVMTGRDGTRTSISANRNGSYTSKLNRSDSTNTQPPQDRILTWRQGIQSSASIDRNKAMGGGLRQNSDAISVTSKGTINGHDGMPRKSMSITSFSMRSNQYIPENESPLGHGHTPMVSSPTGSPPGHGKLRAQEPHTPERAHETQGDHSKHDKSPTSASSVSHFRSHSGHDASSFSSPERPGVEVTTPQGDVHPAVPSHAITDRLDEDVGKNNPLMLSGGKSFMFWDPRAYMSNRFFGERPSLIGPVRSKASVVSAVSLLSSEEDDSKEKEQTP